MELLHPSGAARWRKGEVATDGSVFWRYRKNGSLSFIAPEKKQRYHISQILATARQRSKVGNYPFDLTLDYLISIFPEDNKCPIFGVDLEWASKKSRNLCPSLDKTVPHLGYVEGNVAWMSLEANRIKDNASLQTLKKLVAYVEGSHSRLH